MSARFIFVTGSDTDAGKTVCAAALTRELHRRGTSVAALKPLCSGGRGDARVLRAAAGGVLALEEVNPWHFRMPVAPLLAARGERRRITLPAVVVHARQIAKRFELVIVEGAGGLLSPLGEGFDSRDLVRALQAIPIVVCPNRLGAVNQARLTLAALPARLARRAVVVLSQVNPRATDAGNLALLRELSGADVVCALPRIKPGQTGIAAISQIIQHLNLAAGRSGA